MPAQLSAVQLLRNMEWPSRSPSPPNSPPRDPHSGGHSSDGAFPRESRDEADHPSDCCHREFAPPPIPVSSPLSPATDADSIELPRRDSELRAFPFFRLADRPLSSGAE